MLCCFPQEHNDEDGSTVNYENLGESSTYVRFPWSTTLTYTHQRNESTAVKNLFTTLCYIKCWCSSEAKRNCRMRFKSWWHLTFKSIFFHQLWKLFWLVISSGHSSWILTDNMKEHWGTGSKMFKSVLKQQSGAQMNSETCFSCCNHSSCSYWPLEDPFMKLIWSFSVQMSQIK